MNTSPAHRADSPPNSPKNARSDAPQPELCRRCGEAPAAEDSFGLCRLCLGLERRRVPS